LAKLSDEHFALAAKEYQVEWQAGQPREAATAAILAAAGYK
jgi:hypothetical protein